MQPARGVTNPKRSEVDVDKSTQTKVCVRCGLEKPRDAFYARAKAVDGLTSACKPCLAIRRRERRRMTDEDRAMEIRALVNKPSKVCGACGVEKGRAEFAKRRGSRDGMGPWCRSCTAAYSAQHYQANAETRAEQVRRWREVNAEAFRATQRDYYQQRKGEYARRREMWKRNNPDRMQEYHRRRRARIAGGAVDEIDLGALWNGECGICGGALDPGLAHPDPMSKSVDHIVPLARGGAHTQQNLQWAHLICNMRKGTSLTLPA